MKLNEFLTESEQHEIEMLQEGPLGSLAKAAATGVGKAVGGVAKGVGAVAGGIAGIGKALKKGLSAGKKTVGGDDEEPQGTTAAGSPDTSSGGTSTQPAAGTTTSQPAQPSTGAETQPAAQPAPAKKPAVATAAPANNTQPNAAVKDTAYAQAQKALQGLAPAQQKEIYDMLIADPKVKAAMAKPAASSADFDPEFGVPITPAGVASYAKHGAKANAKKADAALAAGWTHDGQTGIWSPPNKAKAASSAPARKTGAVKIGGKPAATKAPAKTGTV